MPIYQIVYKERIIKYAFVEASTEGEALEIAHELDTESMNEISYEADYEHPEEFNPKELPNGEIVWTKEGDYIYGN